MALQFISAAAVSDLIMGLDADFGKNALSPLTVGSWQRITFHSFPNERMIF